jgi:hypothetical protein
MDGTALAATAAAPAAVAAAAEESMESASGFRRMRRFGTAAAGGAGVGVTLRPRLLPACLTDGEAAAAPTAPAARATLPAAPALATPAPGRGGTGSGFGPEEGRGIGFGPEDWAVAPVAAPGFLAAATGAASAGWPIGRGGALPAPSGNIIALNAAGTPLGPPAAVPPPAAAAAAAFASASFFALSCAIFALSDCSWALMTGNRRARTSRWRRAALRCEGRTECRNWLVNLECAQ